MSCDSYAAITHNEIIAYDHTQWNHCLRSHTTFLFISLCRTYCTETLQWYC